MNNFGINFQLYLLSGYNIHGAMSPGLYFIYIYVGIMHRDKISMLVHILYSNKFILDHLFTINFIAFFLLSILHVPIYSPVLCCSINGVGV